MDAALLRGFLLLPLPPSISLRLVTRPFIEAVRLLPRSNYTTDTESLAGHQTGKENKTDQRGKWFTLPPYTFTVTGAALGKALTTNDALKFVSETTALKWVLQCCPQLPRDLVQKLFRLRQVRREPSGTGCSSQSDQTNERAVKRVKAKDLMNVGDRIYLPFSVHVSPIKELECLCSEEEVNFIRSLVLYKDEVIIIVNKPPGMAVQGGIGIKRSLDELSTSCLRYEYSEPPRLVHRLDRDCSGILVLGRTRSSTTALHSIFREKTLAASNDDVGDNKRILQRRYWALVFGRPRHSKGIVSAPLGKMVVDNGKSDRITVTDNAKSMSSQPAMTEYRVIASSPHGTTVLFFFGRVLCLKAVLEFGFMSHQNACPVLWNLCVVLPGCHSEQEFLQATHGWN